MDTIQLTLTFKKGSTPADIAADLRFQAGIFEGMEPKAAASRKNTDSAAEDSDYEPKKSVLSVRKKAVSFEEDEEAQEHQEEEFEEEVKPKKKVSKKALTQKDVALACQEKMADTDRETVMKILKSKFKVKSITQLEPEQFADVIAAMAV